MKFTPARIIVLILILFIVVGTVSMADTIVRPNETQQLMQKFLTEFTALKKFMVSPEKFEDPKNAAEISAHLQKFAKLTKEAAHDPQLNQESFKFSRFVLEDHIVNTERVFRLGNKSYARWQLASAASVCTSCHTQAPRGDRAFSEFLDTKMFSSEFDRAEFLFATRSFDRAFESFDKIIQGFPENSNGGGQVEAALERQVAYFSRVKRDPSIAIKTMKGYQANTKLPTHLKKNLTSWIQQFQTLSKREAFNPRAASEKQIVEFAKKNLDLKWTKEMMDSSNPNLVTYLYVSGVLFEYLQTHPQNKATPEVLYWLAVCDRSINTNFFYSLADLYLKECIITFPASSIAKQCFKEYEAEMINGYTGSSGMHVPEDVKEELDKLRELVNGNGKVELKKQ